MTDKATRPLIGVSADFRELTNAPFHVVGDKYLRAVMLASEAMPMVIPSFGDLYDMPDLVQRLDGLLLTGSPSNVYPERYGEAPSEAAEPYDPERDDTTFPMIDEALAQGVPLLAICRGFQELNVALGGTLHARVHELPERFDHRAPKVDDPDVKYGLRHPVHFTAGGIFADLAGKPELQVNSLHWQGVNGLAEALTLEAVAHDETVEAVSVCGAASFALGVQWHPEYKVLDDPFSVALFGEFGAAARARQRRRAQGDLAPRSGTAGRWAAAAGA